MRGIGQVGALALALAGCGGAELFVCTDDASCSGGTCQPSGFCSFDDPACASGQRYGAHAPAQLAGRCTDSGNADGPIATSTSDGAMSATNTSPATESATMGGVDATGDGTVTSPDDATAVSDSLETSAGPGDATADETSPSMPVCLIEAFDDEALEQWAVIDDGAATTVIADGRFTVELAGIPSSAGLDPIGSGVAEGSLVVAMPEAPNQVLGTQVYVGVASDTDAYLMLLVSGNVVLRHAVGEEFDNFMSVPWDEDSLWWRIDVAGGELVFAMSADGVEWQELDVIAPAFALDDARWILRAGSWTNPRGSPGVASFEQLELCTVQ